MRPRWCKDGHQASREATRDFQPSRTAGCPVGGLGAGWGSAVVTACNTVPRSHTWRRCAWVHQTAFLVRSHNACRSCGYQPRPLAGRQSVFWKLCGTAVDEGGRAGDNRVVRTRAHRGRRSHPRLYTLPSTWRTAGPRHRSPAGADGSARWRAPRQCRVRSRLLLHRGRERSVTTPVRDAGGCSGLLPWVGSPDVNSGSGRQRKLVEPGRSRRKTFASGAQTGARSRTTPPKVFPSSTGEILWTLWITRIGGVRSGDTVRPAERAT